MKSFKLILAAAFAVVGLSATAQVNFDDPKYAVWGDTADERKQNMLDNQFMKEAVDNRNYNLAAKYLQSLLEKCPKASQNIYTNGIKLYKNKINRAETAEEKDMYIDSLLLLYDIRMENFGNHSTYGKAYILDRKARELMTYRPDDREGIRKLFSEAIAASEEKNGAPDLDLVAIYFSALCDDYKNDLVSADAVIADYDRFTPAFEKAGEDAAALKEQFDAAFGASGAASCENLEALFSKRLAETPDDEAVLAQAVSLMSRANCDSDFFFQTAEKYYSIKPSSETALFLAQGFQNRQEYDKALKYLEEALSVETDPAEKEKLYVRVGMIGISTKDYAKAIDAANQIKSLNPENGYSYFILGQCYAASANCSEFQCLACYWAAYDTMSQAVSLLGAEPEIQKAAQTLMANYRQGFPTKEECFFAEVSEGSRYTVSHGYANGVNTTVRYR